MRYSTKLAILFLSCIVGFTASAACDSISCSSKIKRLYITNNGSVYIEPDDSQKNALDCSLAENNFITLRRSHVAFKELYSMALAAKMAEKPLRMRISTGTTGCAVSYFWMK